MATEGERRSKPSRARSANVEPESRRPTSKPEGPKNLPLAAPAALRDAFAVLADREQMLEVLQRELGRLAQGSLRVTRCKAKVQRSRAALRQGRIRIVYQLRIVVADELGSEGDERELIVLGTAPESAEFLDHEPCRAVRGHPALAPFTEPALHVAELQLALRIYPLDPNLPALAELEGPGGAMLLASHLGARAAGAAPERLERELKHYKPFKRAVLRVRAFSSGAPEPRVLYAKVFADERGALLHREHRALWDATRSARALRIPEPLGYDPARRMLLMGEAPGRPDLIDWIKGLENHRTLPPEVGFERVLRCMAVAAEALAELQASGIQPHSVLGYRQQLARMDKGRLLLRGELAERHPELTRQAEELLRRLEARMPAREELVPAHGGFRHKQMVGDEHSLAVIDWDGLCRADPALDAATFLLRLRQEPLREPGSAPEMERLADTFRREFLARVPRVSPAHLALYEGLALTQGTLRSFRRAAKDDGMERTIGNLATAAAQALDRA